MRSADVADTGRLERGVGERAQSLGGRARAARAARADPASRARCSSSRNGRPAVDAERLERRAAAREALVGRRDHGTRGVDDAEPETAAASGARSSPRGSRGSRRDGSEGRADCIEQRPRRDPRRLDSAQRYPNQTMPPPTQRWMRPSATANVGVSASRGPRSGRRGRARPCMHRGRRLHRPDEVDGRELRCPGDRAAGKARRRAPRCRRRRGAGPRRSTRGARRPRLRSATAAPASGPCRAADPGEVVALEVDDHHVLGGVLGRLEQLAPAAGGPGALDRHGPDRALAARGRLGRGRPPPSRLRRTAAAGAAARRWRARGGQRRDRPRTARRVPDEVHLVDVAPRDRGASLLDRVAVSPSHPRCASRRRCAWTPGSTVGRPALRRADGTAASGSEHGSGGTGGPSGGSSRRARSRGRGPRRETPRRARRTPAPGASSRSARTPSRPRGSRAARPRVRWNRLSASGSSSRRDRGDVSGPPPERL